MKSRRLVCLESSILKGDGGRFTTRPPARLEARQTGDRSGKFPTKNFLVFRSTTGICDSYFEVLL